MTGKRVAPSSSPHSFQPGVGGIAKAPATEVARAEARRSWGETQFSVISPSATPVILYSRSNNSLFFDSNSSWVMSPRFFISVSCLRDSTGSPPPQPPFWRQSAGPRSWCIASRQSGER